MKFNKILLSLALGSLLVGFSACTDEVEYVPAEAAPVTDYYFPTTNAIEQSLVDGTKSFEVTVARADSKGEVTLPINSSVSEEGLFDIPQSVTFADGIGTVSFSVGYNLNDLEVNKHYTIKFWLDDMVNTPYSYGEFEVDVCYLPWRDFEANNSIGLYREDLLTLFYNVPVTTYKVKIQQHPTIDGIYRLVNPYGAAYPYNEEGDYDTSADHYMIVDARKPKGVYVQSMWTGLDWGSGEFYISSLAYYNMLDGGTLDEQIAAGLCGTINNGIIKMPEKSMLVTISPKYSGLYYGNLSGGFKIVLPGYEDEPEWEEVGMCDFTDGLFSPCIGVKDHTYKVLVEKSLVKDGVYRILNPYGQASGFVDTDPEIASYLEFDASDPDFVLIGTYDTGLSFDGQSALYVTTYADYEIMNGASAADLKKEGFGGKFKNNVITIAKEDAVLLHVSTLGVTPMYPDAANETETRLDLNSAVPTTPEESVEPTAVKAKINKKAVKPLHLFKAENVKMAQ